MRDTSRDSVVDRHCLCQRYVPYAVNSRPTSRKIFGRFLVRSVILFPKVFIATPMDVFVFKFREIWLTEIGKIVHTVRARM